jgi:hypothetical protein
MTAVSVPDVGTAAQSVAATGRTLTAVAVFGLTVMVALPQTVCSLLKSSSRKICRPTGVPLPSVAEILRVFSPLTVEKSQQSPTPPLQLELNATAGVVAPSNPE